MNSRVYFFVARLCGTGALARESQHSAFSQTVFEYQVASFLRQNRSCPGTECHEQIRIGFLQMRKPSAIAILCENCRVCGHAVSLCGAAALGRQSCRGRSNPRQSALSVMDGHCRKVESRNGMDSVADFAGEGARATQDCGAKAARDELTTNRSVWFRRSNRNGCRGLIAEESAGDRGRRSKCHS